MSFTCLNCNVLLQNETLYKEHYKSDWHRYNLKRKIASLPAVSAGEFKIILLDQKNGNSSSITKALYCEACRKIFKSVNALGNHMRSKKHTECMKDLIKEKDTLVDTSHYCINKFQKKTNCKNLDIEECSENFNSVYNAKSCLFCDFQSSNVLKNLKHMSVVHSFFIPDREYCIDLHGLLKYLHEKICRGFICLWCNFHSRSFQSLSAVRKHMQDKCHCRMLYEDSSMDEYKDFYDYSKSYPDHSENVDIDEELEDVNQLEEDIYQLILPSGMTVGHRSLLRYYGQKKSEELFSFNDKDPNKKLKKMLAESR